MSVLEYILAALLAPVVLGIVSGLLFKDFTLGAGVGIFIMIGMLATLPFLEREKWTK